MRPPQGMSRTEASNLHGGYRKWIDRSGASCMQQSAMRARKLHAFRVFRRLGNIGLELPQLHWPS